MIFFRKRRKCPREFRLYDKQVISTNIFYNHSNRNVGNFWLTAELYIKFFVDISQSNKNCSLRFFLCQPQKKTPLANSNIVAEVTRMEYIHVRKNIKIHWTDCTTCALFTWLASSYILRPAIGAPEYTLTWVRYVFCQWPLVFLRFYSVGKCLC